MVIIILLILLVLCVIFLSLKIETSNNELKKINSENPEKFSNCSLLGERDCMNASNCGWCIDDSNVGKCQSADDKISCQKWYPSNPPVTVIQQPLDYSYPYYNYGWDYPYYNWGWGRRGRRGYRRRYRRRG